MKGSMKFVLRSALLAAALAVAACGDTPESTNEARGFLEGYNVVLALSVIFLVVAGALVVGAIAIDRAISSRRALDEAPAAAGPAEEEEEVVAGIGVGRAPVPRWLYGFYVVIPVFALLYVLNAVALAPEKPKATATPKPTGPVTEVTVVAKSIAFDADLLTFPATTAATVTFDNQDAGIPHTLTIWEDETAATAGDEGKKIADTGQFNGVAERELKFTTPVAGDYYFNCIVHPAMKGDVKVV
jgi:plastocyanin